MATNHKISVELRTDAGKGASRRLRRTGKVPAVVYGGDLEAKAIQLDHNSIYLLSHKEWFYSAILDLSLDGDVQAVLLRDMQRHPFKPQILHMDFQRVDINKPIRVRVSLHFLNQETSPAGKKSGVVISHAQTEVEVLCLPKDLPEFIAVDLGALEVGQIVHLSELVLPEGVEIPELRFGKEHDQPVVTAAEARGGAEPEPEAAAAAAPAAGKAAPAKAAPAGKAAPAAKAAAPAAAPKKK